MDSYRLRTLSSLLDAWVIPHCSPGHLTHPKGPSLLCILNKHLEMRSRFLLK